jgi:serine-type D-Ala-D-Ala carboxypeptidase/endopeptidase (penicillin-binding protein 4)
MKRPARLHPFIWFCIAFLFGLPASPPLSAKNWGPVEKLIGDRDAVLVADPQGTILYSRHADQKLVPASTLKILTSLVARRHLGPDHRFITEFYLDPKNNLKIKGYGDPFLISEVISDIAETLASKIDRCGDLVLDDSFFEKEVIPGVSASYNPYDSPNGALCANFNTVNFKCTGGKCTSAEPQTPFVSFVVDRVCESGLPKGRIVLSAENNEITLYTGYLFRHFLEREGVSCTGKVRMGRVTGEDRLIHRYTSVFSLNQVISKLLEFSNNFVANQLFIAAGAAAYGPPGNLEKGVRAAEVYMREHLEGEDIQLVEGSGISRKNRISARSMLKVLKKFEPHHHLMTHQNGQYYKTGSLSDVKARAGYMAGATGKLYPFVVLVNTPGKTADRIIAGIRRVLIQ